MAVIQSLDRPLNIISWSGGKDSSATVILAHEHGIPIDLVIMSIVWFDKKRGICGENPKHIDWALNYAKPLFESWGYKVVLVSSERDYMFWFNHIIYKSKIPERNGKKAGWLLGGKCYMNREKANPIRDYLKALKTPYVMYEGIALDEPERLKSMHEKRNALSLLEQFEYNEDDTYPLCRKYGLLSPIYSGKKKRQGCWYCPNQSLEEMADTKENYPELWGELETLSKDDNLVTQKFKWGETFEEVNEKLDTLIANRQLSFVDVFGEESA